MKTFNFESLVTCYLQIEESDTTKRGSGLQPRCYPSPDPYVRGSQLPPQSHTVSGCLPVEGLRIHSVDRLLPLMVGDQLFHHPDTHVVHPLKGESRGMGR